MQRVKEISDGTFLVYETPLGFGQTPASAGVAVWYYHRSQRWVCEECGDASLPTRTLRESLGFRGACSHVEMCIGEDKNG